MKRVFTSMPPMERRPDNTWVDTLTECPECGAPDPVERMASGLKRCRECHIGFPNNPGEVYEPAPVPHIPNHPDDIYR